MSEPVFIPVYGSAKDIRMKILENNLEESFTAMTPLKAMLSGEGKRMSFTDTDVDEFDDDICFIISTEEISDEEKENIVTLLKVVPAPVTMESIPDQDEDDEILEALEDDVISSDEDRIDRFHRFQDTLGRIKRRDHNSHFASVIPLRGKVISHMIKEGSTQTMFLMKFPTTGVSHGAHLPDVQPDPDAPIASVFNAVRLTPVEDGAVSVDGNGSDVLVTDVDAVLFLETMTPCIVTAVTLSSDSDDQEVRSWVIHDDEINGMPHMASQQVIDEVSDSAEDIGIDLDRIRYFWPEDIDVNQVSIISPLYNDHVVDQIVSQIFERDDDVFGGDHDGDGNGNE